LAGGRLCRQEEDFQVIKALLIAVVSAPIPAAPVSAQQPPVKRTIIQTVDFPPGLTTVTYFAEITPGSCSGRHSHPSIDR
jgi:hypothetical protein